MEFDEATPAKRAKRTPPTHNSQDYWTLVWPVIGWTLLNCADNFKQALENQTFGHVGELLRYAKHLSGGHYHVVFHAKAAPGERQKCKHNNYTHVHIVLKTDANLPKMTRFKEIKSMCADAGTTPEPPQTCYRIFGLLNYLKREPRVTLATAGDIVNMLDVTEEDGRNYDSESQKYNSKHEDAEYEDMLKRKRDKFQDQSRRSAIVTRIRCLLEELHVRTESTLISHSMSLPEGSREQTELRNITSHPAFSSMFRTALCEFTAAQTLRPPLRVVMEADDFYSTGTAPLAMSEQIVHNLFRGNIRKNVNQVYDVVFRKKTKVNCLFFIGPPNGGKSLLVRSIVGMYAKPGYVSNQCNNQFMFENAVDVDVICIEELCVDHTQIENLKLLLEGGQLHTQRKNISGGGMTSDVPVISSGNVEMYSMCWSGKDAIEARIEKIRLDRADWLKRHSMYKRLHPGLWRNLFEKYVPEYKRVSDLAKNDHLMAPDHPLGLQNLPLAVPFDMASDDSGTDSDLLPDIDTHDLNDRGHMYDYARVAEHFTVPQSLAGLQEFMRRVLRNKGWQLLPYMNNLYCSLQNVGCITDDTSLCYNVRSGAYIKLQKKEALVEYIRDMYAEEDQDIVDIPVKHCIEQMGPDMFTNLTADYAGLLMDDKPYWELHFKDNPHFDLDILRECFTFNAQI